MEAYFKLGGEIFYLPYINEVNILFNIYIYI